MRVTRLSKNSISHIIYFAMFKYRCAYSFIWRNKQSINRQPRYSFYIKKNVDNMFGRYKLWVEIDFYYIILGFNIFA